MAAASRSRSRRRTSSEKAAKSPEASEPHEGSTTRPEGQADRSAELRSPLSAPSADGKEDASIEAKAASTSPGSTMPLVPSIPVPARTKVVVTVPVKVKVSPQATLLEVRKQLVTAGIPVESTKGAFHCRGEPEAVDETLPVGELQDTRLTFFPEPDMQPWQLCAAHRACERLVQQRLGGGWAASRHPFYKTRLCKNFAQQGSCIHGARCVYAHGPGELQRAQVAPGLPWPSPSGAKAPPVKVPEVVFTVDKEEERRRAERAKRFAPRAASFEAKEAPAEEKGSPEEELDIDEVDPMVGHIDEEQIAEYLMEMQQQLLGGDGDGGFDFEFGQEEAEAAAPEEPNTGQSDPDGHGDA